MICSSRNIQKYAIHVFISVLSRLINDRLLFGLGKREVSFVKVPSLLRLGGEFLLDADDELSLGVQLQVRRYSVAMTCTLFRALCMAGTRPHATRLSFLASVVF